MGAFRLLVSRTAGVWQEWTISAADINLGRGTENQVVLDDGSVSRQHARLHIDGSKVWVIDLNSSNGVFLNGRKLQPNTWVELAPGQIFQLGVFSLYLELAVERTAAPLSPSQPLTTPYQPPVAERPRNAVPAPARAPVPARRNGWILPVVLVTGLICLCAIVGVAGWQFWGKDWWQNRQTQQASGTDSQPAVSTIPEVETKVLSNLPVAAGSAVQDEYGTSLVVTENSLSGGQPASLRVSELGGKTRKDLEAGYTIETPLYGLEAGTQDSLGGSTINLTAPSPDSRVMVLVNGKYPGLLDVQPVDGKLSVDIPPEVGKSDSEYPMAQPGTGLQFMVVTPKQSGGLNPAPGAMHLAAQTDPDGASCIAEFWTVSHCWRNVDSTVYVFWENNYPVELKNVEYLRVIDTIHTVEGIMRDFNQKHGFTNAAITSARPVYIVIEAGLKEPYYSPFNRTVNIDWGFVANSSSDLNRCTIAHELMHWIEHRTYYMVANYYSNPGSWWLEIAADNGTYLLSDACLDRTLTGYGYVTTEEDILGFQADAFKWDSGEQARYIQSLQMYLSICSGGANCAISQEQYVAAINGGTFPMESTSAQAAYNRNAKDFGRYLLGSAPAESRGSAAIPASARTGSMFGDYAVIKGVGGTSFETGIGPKAFTKKDDKTMEISARIMTGGVYPLYVGNGAGTPASRNPGVPGLPGVLKVDAGGPAFWVKLDGAEPVYYDGSSEALLGVISAKLGYGLARVMAVSPDAEKTFKATLKLADFSGDWSSMGKGTPSVNVIDCSGSEESDDSGSAASTMDAFLQIFSGYGTYVLDSAVTDGSHYVWNGSFPEEGVSANSEITVTPEEIKLEYEFVIPQPESSGAAYLNLPMPIDPKPQPAPAALSLIVPVLPVTAVLMRKRRPLWVRAAGLAVLLLAVSVVCTGCFGLALWGTISGEYIFKHAEVVDPNKSAGSTDLYILSDGNAKITYDLTIEVEVAGTDGGTTTETAPCKLEITVPVDGKIGPPDSVTPPNSGSD